MILAGVAIVVSPTNSSSSGNSISTIAVLSVFVGIVVFGLGLLLVPQSTLAGAHIAAVGLSLVFSGAVAIEWVGTRLHLSAASRRNLSFGFAMIAVFLLVVFVVVNFAFFEGSSVESSG